MEKQPEQFNIKDLTQKIELQSEMNRHISWLINLTLILDLRSYHDKLVSGRTFLANMIDATAHEKR
ncbi:hypothetical protein LCGC14_2924100 [marine sediment metagenome]|uniref:Uncharacterized protein n=1 Tax=marine sediment metagenome TaxID=412755 RepID=A0A0F8XN93_9ZZZZ